MKTLLSLIFFISSTAFCSTTFFIDGTKSMAMGKSYDWQSGHGMVVSNKRNVEKSSFVVRASDQKITWKSLYGSLTFNQFGVEMPSGGVNEKGLVIEIVRFAEAVYPSIDTRPTLNELQWVQYQLDQYESLQEVLGNLDSIRISGLFGKVHYLVCDSTRNCGVIELINGKLVAYSNGKVLTNNSYEQSQKHLSLFDGYGGTLPIPTDNTSLSRFVRITDYLKKFREGYRNNVIETSFTALNLVRHSFIEESKTTVWNTVYDLDKMKVHFVHTLVGLKKFVDMNRMDFSCQTLRQIYNIESHQGNGDVSGDFLNYKKSYNQRIIQLSLKDFMLKLPTQKLEELIELPETFHCIID